MDSFIAVKFMALLDLCQTVQSGPPLIIQALHLLSAILPLARFLVGFLLLRSRRNLLLSIKYGKNFIHLHDFNGGFTT